MNNLVRLDTTEDGDITDDESWHLVSDSGGSSALLCNTHVFGYGEGEAKYVTKTVVRGGITCPDCLHHIRKMKEVKL